MASNLHQFKNANGYTIFVNVDYIAKNALLITESIDSNKQTYVRMRGNEKVYIDVPLEELMEVLKTKYVELNEIETLKQEITMLRIMLDSHNDY